MFRLLMFLVGLAIGSWLLRSPHKQDTSTQSPARPDAAQNGRGDVKSFSKPTPSATQAAARLRADSDAAKTKEIEVVVDNLLDIKGIGPTFVNRLNDLGITSFAQLADENPQDLAEKMGGRVTAERIARLETEVAGLAGTNKDLKRGVDELVIELRRK
jgi:predicted flap endonuclease-1-like 5' DNA nuclease